MQVPTASVDADTDITYGAGSYVIRFKATRVNPDSKLVLTAVNNSSNGYVTYFLDSGSKAHLSSVSGAGNVDVAGDTNKVATVLYKVEVQLFASNDTNYATPLTLTGSALEVFNFSDTVYTVKYTASAEDGATTAVAHDAFIYQLSSSEAERVGADSDPYTEGTYFTDPASADANKATYSIDTGDWNGATQTLGYFAVRVDGGAHDDQANKVTTGAVTVTITGQQGQ